MFSHIDLHCVRYVKGHFGVNIFIIKAARDVKRLFLNKNVYIKNVYMDVKNSGLENPATLPSDVILATVSRLLPSKQILGNSARQY